MDESVKLRKSDRCKRLRDYSTAATAVLMLASNSQAKVVYTDANPDEAIIRNTTPSAISIDLDGGGVPDLEVFHFFSNSYGSSSWAAGFDPTEGAQILAYNGSSTYSSFALPLSAAYTVDENINGAVWYSGGLLRSVSSQSSYGLWPTTGQPKYLGVRFEIGAGQVHYGWVLLSVVPNAVIIHSYAYEDQPGVPITTGEIPPTFPGDSDQDGQLGLSDVVHSLQTLTGTGAP